MELKVLEKISKALGDIHRLKILTDMSARGGCIQCAEIMHVTDLAQPSVSHHIKILSEAGLIASERDGRNYSYTLNGSVLNEYLTEITAIATI